MGTYLVLWDMDWDLIPQDLKERAEAWKIFLDFVREDMDKGLTKEWGTFIGETSGYAINEGTETEIMNMLQRYIPYVHFEAHHVASLSQVEELTKLMGGED